MTNRKYLSPEPLLQSPGYLAAMAERGIQVATFSYAANNPFKFIDPNGLELKIGAGEQLEVPLRDAHRQRYKNRLSAIPEGAMGRPGRVHHGRPMDAE